MLSIAYNRILDTKEAVGGYLAALELKRGRRRESSPNAVYDLERPGES
jgi:hypothetical protein